MDKQRYSPTTGVSTAEREESRKRQPSCIHAYTYTNSFAVSHGELVSAPGQKMVLKLLNKVFACVMV